MMFGINFGLINWGLLNFQLHYKLTSLDSIWRRVERVARLGTAAIDIGAVRIRVGACSRERAGGRKRWRAY
jgi:hypothetical protein